MRDLEQKVVVVTGTANPRGIGLAIARRFAARGCRIALADIDAEGAEARAAEMRSEGNEAIALRADMSDHSSVLALALADAVYGHFGTTHVLVLNHVAPTGGPGHGLLDPDPDSWELHARVNLLGCVYGIKAFVPRMLAAGEEGYVLATTSGAGGTGTMYGNGPYAVTKSAIVSLMECLYGQLRDAGARVAAGTIWPGVTNTFPSDEDTRQVVAFMRSSGLPATFTEPQEVAQNALDAVLSGSFWARPSVDDEAHRETVEWESQIYRTRAETLIARDAPDAYLWGPASDLLAR